MPSTFDFSNQVAVITGVSSGIGLSTVKLFLASKCAVLGVDLSPIKDEELLAAASDSKSKFHFYQTDITKKEAPKEILAACIARFGPHISVLANVAGIVDNFGTAVTTTDEMMDRVLDVNLKAPIRLMGAVLPNMVEHGGGAIVNVSSRAGFSGACSGLSYSASKHGLIGATKNTAWQFRDKNVRCNVVAPGVVMTGMKPDPATMDMEAYGNVAPLLGSIASETRPPIDPLAIAEAIAFLASDLSVNMSGSIVPVDKAWCTI